MMNGDLRNHDGLIPRRASILALFAALSFLSGLGCDKGKCKTNADCPAGEICSHGKCKSSGADAGTESGWGVTTDSTTQSISDSVSNSGADTDADGDGDSDTSADAGPDSGTSCEATFLNGDTCAQGCECLSGYCENSICCGSGECCNSPETCENDRCMRVSCDGNHECVYGTADLTCGVEDNEGIGLCNGGNVCNGQGQCVPVAAADCGYFAVSGHSCDATQATETCYESCTDADFSMTCLPNAICVSGECAAGGIGLADGAACEIDKDCASTHCGNGFCCPIGECCGATADCSAPLCRNRSCSNSFRCVYDYNGYSCGMEDGTEGDACADGTRCDGLGGCVTLAACLGPYAGNPTAIPAYTCDAEQAVETCFATCETSAECATGYVCTPPLCEPSGLIGNGEPCPDPDSCESGYCANGFCCASGTCCGTAEDCDGALCDANSQCAGPCGGDDALCGAAYHCEVESCVEDFPDGLGPCDSDGDCESGHCTPESGICCVGGESECCVSVLDCDDDDPCTVDTCAADYACFHAMKNVGESCDDGSFCNGVEQCDALGACVPDSSQPCPAGDNPCMAGSCDEVNDRCIDTPIGVGEPCSEVLFCLSGRSKVCTDDGFCEDPAPEAGTPCDQDPENVCTYYTCDEENEACIAIFLDNGAVCDDDDPCNGQNECQNGLCVYGPDLPCDDYNPCTVDTCTNNAGDPVCGENVPIEDGEPCDEGYACFGSAPVCMSGECIPSEDICADQYGISTIFECQSHYYHLTDCGTAIPNPGFVVSCGETVTVDDPVIFATREYYQYSADCGGTFQGKEALLMVYAGANGGDITVTVSNVEPAAGDLALFDLGDWHNASTCMASSANALTFTALAGYNPIVLDSMEVFPPTRFDITVSDCP